MPHNVACSGVGMELYFRLQPRKGKRKDTIAQSPGITAATARTSRPTHFVPHSANMIDGNGMHAYRVLSAASHRRIFNYR